MAKLGFDYQVDVEATDKQGGGGVLPRMNALIWAEALTFTPTKDGKGHQAELAFEVQEPEEFKGRKFWAYWTIVHSDEWNHGAYKYGKPMFDRFARAVQVMVNGDTDSDEMLFKTFVAEIDIQPGNPKGDGTFYKDKNQIAHFYYSDPDAKEPIPELGVIGDGSASKPAAAAPKPANDNRQPAANQNNRSAPAAAARPAAAAGARPWGKK